MKAIVSVIFASLLAAPALAQVPQTPPHAPMQADPQDSDITNIIRGILGDTQFPMPGGIPPIQSMGIENIPVNVEIDPSAIYEGEWIVISAHAPQKSNAPQDKGELLGETRLLLRGLTPPLNVVIAAPAAVTMELDYAIIRGHIEDRNGKTILVSQQDGRFNGAEASKLMLAPKPVRVGVEMPPQTIVKFEQTRGQVDITGSKDLFRGAVLTVQLTETGLVGGNTNAIKGETRLQIDGQQPPFKFTLDYGVPENGYAMPQVISAFISDWAGRKTHVMAKPLEFNGPDYDYRLKLDAYKQGQDVGNFNFTTPENAAQIELRGQAIFNAYKGLPRGSYLKVRLRSPLGPGNQPREISTTAISLNGQSGNIDFIASAPSINFDPELPTPLIDLTIVNPSGNVIFESESQPVNTSSVNLITLSPRPIY